MDIPSFGYFPRSVWDEKEYENPDTGEIERLTSDSRLIVRFLKGSFVIVAKRSVFNMYSGHTDARHNNMGESNFKQYIQQLVGKFGNDYGDRLNEINAFLRSTDNMNS